MEKPAIDEQKTVEAVDGFLSAYRDYALLADMEYIPKVTASFSEELKSFGSGGQANGFESAIDRKADAEEHVQRVIHTIEGMPKDFQAVLYEKYISPEAPTDEIIYARENWSRATYYRKLKKARISFARRWGRNPRLLKFEKKSWSHF